MVCSLYRVIRFTLEVKKVAMYVHDVYEHERDKSECIQKAKKNKPIDSDQ